LDLVTSSLLTGALISGLILGGIILFLWLIYVIEASERPATSNLVMFVIFAFVWVTAFFASVQYNYEREHPRHKQPTSSMSTTLDVKS